MESSKRIKIQQMKTYTKSDFHNPEQLTRQQVGAEYRLLLPEEVDGRFGSKGNGIASYWSIHGHWIPSGNIIASLKQCNYRVPLATPLPDGTVLSSSGCCFSDAPAKPRIYCAGAMSSHPDDFNFPAFFKASEELEKQGYEAINPAQLDIDAGYTLEKLKQLSPAEFREFLKGAVRRDLDAIQTCQAIAMLPGWESSKGAKAELAVAQWLGLDEVYLEDAKTPYESKEPDADGWIPHIPGDPMPCKQDDFIDIVDSLGFSYYSYQSLGGLYWDNDYHNPIIKWRPAQPKQPYNSDERAEWGSGFCKIDMGDYSSTATAQYAADDPKGAAGAKKAPMHLLPPDALIEIAKVMGEGARKYQPWNFIAARVCASTYIGAILRHWAEFAKGRDMDDGAGGSGLSHLSHIAANCMILLTAKRQGTLNDDRPKLK
jgi:hypothetical protein